MTPLKAARRLAANWPCYQSQTDRTGYSYAICACCHRDDQLSTHTSDCAYLAMPQIVAALEVAERLKEKHERGDYAEDMEGDIAELSAALKGQSA